MKYSYLIQTPVSQPHLFPTSLILLAESCGGDTMMLMHAAGKYLGLRLQRHQRIRVQYRSASSQGSWTVGLMARMGLEGFGFDVYILSFLLFLGYCMM